jgi:anaerobic C4-dicarboxylate transporter
MQWLLFVVFALVLAAIYLSIRRGWFAPSLTAGVGVLLSIILMTLFSLAQNNIPIQAIIVGILLGSLFSGATLAAAWYFHSQELRARYAEGDFQEELPADGDY